MKTKIPRGKATKAWGVFVNGRFAKLRAVYLKRKLAQASWFTVLPSVVIRPVLITELPAKRKR